MLKKEVRVLGVDDGPIDKFKDKTSILVGTVFRGGEFLDALLKTDITVDGNDVTDKLITSIKKSKYISQIKCIMLDGLTFAGFNIMDINKLYDKLKIPVIVIMRSRPDKEKIVKTLSRIGMQNKIQLINNSPEVYKYKEIFFQTIGLDNQEATEFLKLTTRNALVPEPLRIAHIIASGIIKGESYGNS